MQKQLSKFVLDGFSFTAVDSIDSILVDPVYPPWFFLPFPRSKDENIDPREVAAWVGRPVVLSWTVQEQDDYYDRHPHPAALDWWKSGGRTDWLDSYPDGIRFTIYRFGSDFMGASNPGGFFCSLEKALTFAEELKTTARTEAVVNLLSRPLSAISMHQSFNQECDDIDVFICDRPQLEALIEAAPCRYSQGFLLGVYQFRINLSIISGREF